MNILRKGFRRVLNRIVNRPSQVQKRNYLLLRRTLEPCRAQADARVQTPKPVLIISGITMKETGIFCNLLAFLRWVRFAQLMDYIPVIDMQNVPNLYLEPHEVGGEVNAYEYFYNQPAGISLKEAYRAKEVYFVNRLDCPYDFTPAQKRAYREATRVKDWVYGENRDKYFDEWKRVYDTFFVQSPMAREYVQVQYERVIAGANKGDGQVLGLLCRGTDYAGQHPYGHQIQPTAQQIMDKVDEYMRGQKVALIFVATEDAAMLDALRAHYGEKLVCIDCPRYSTVGRESIAKALERENANRRLNGLNYFASIALLARCDALIAGKTMATQFIRTMRETPFAYEYYWDLGRYGVKGKR